MHTRFKEGLKSFIISYVAMILYHLPSAYNPLFDIVHMMVIVGTLLYGGYYFYRNGASRNGMAGLLIQVSLFTIGFNIALPLTREIFSARIMFMTGCLLSLIFLKHIENNLYRIDRKS